jgi:hypothetical protein
MYYNTYVTFIFIDFKQSKPVLILPTVVFKFTNCKGFHMHLCSLYILHYAKGRQTQRWTCKRSGTPSTDTTGTKKYRMSVEVYNQEEQEPAPDIALAPNVQVQAPAPIPVPAPVPLQQAPAYLPQAPLAPAHINNGEINDNPNSISS